MLSAGEGAWEAERWEHVVVETGHGADPVAGEGEDEQAGAVADASGGGAKVGPERQLTIRPRRHEVISRTSAEVAGIEAGHDVAALVFEGYWWHGYADIGGEQRDKCFDIAGRVREEELRHSGRGDC